MEESKKRKAAKSAFDSTTFDVDVSIHTERKVGSATISPSGRDVALASTDGLDIIDLDNPLSSPRHLRHGLPWLVADVQWSPFAVRDYWVVSTANQKALVWNLNMQEDAIHGAIEHTLNGHTRAITDINFSAHHPDMLATCAVDGYVNCWDLRRPKQPALTFVDWFAGATQVKWNRQDPHILASSHDRWLRIWDDRHGARPLKSINAHESKIYGVDWNRTRTTGVVTCSLDKSIKFWDYGNEVDEPERIIRTDFPVWRARHTPFGWGLLAMPQDIPGHLHLYNRRLDGEVETDFAAPAVKTFLGHGNCKVKEFLWRSRGGITDDGVDNRDFQLVSWGEDNHLRLQYVDPEILERVGYMKGSQVRKKLIVTRKGAAYKTFRTSENSSTDKKVTATTAPRPGSSGLRVSALSAGMKKLSTPHTMRTYTMIRPPAMRAKDRSKAEDQHSKHIDWMSGVKFTKRDTLTSKHKRSTSRRLSLLDPEFEEDGDWDAPETLHEEVIRLRDQLPKITFENADMEKRTLVVSMNGPWSDDGSPIYIKMTAVFPEQYPESKAPSFILNKTSLMPEGTYEKLDRDIKQIAVNFLSRKQGCLEAALCYLLGEVDLETSTTLLKDGEEIDDDLDGLADESSSDDEDMDIPAGASAMMSQELELSASGELLAPINRNVNVPLPRMCGAQFSANGVLVCFFAPKEEKMKSLLGAMVDKNNARSKGVTAFEAFGRLHNSSPVPRGKSVSAASQLTAESGDSDDSEVSSSDSDSTQFPIARFPMPGYLRRASRPQPYGKASSTILSQKSSAAGTGTGTGTGTLASKLRPSKPKTFVALHKLRDLLDAKIELANGYAIFGDGPDVCEHNAIVARKCGYDDLADIWRYAAILLHNEVPLEVLDQSHRREPILVIAREVLKRNRTENDSDSGVDVSSDGGARRNSLSGRVKWGTSPLAQQLIADLFMHFEALADIQMLAMLSCIFSEPLAQDAQDTVANAEVKMSQPQTPLTMKTPGFSLDYFPTDAAAWSMYHRTPLNSAVSTPKLVQTPSGLYGSMGSSNGPWGSDPTSASYSCGETPPLRSGHASSEHLHQQAQSLSTSPENPRGFRRANSGITSSLAASFSRGAFSTTASSSPPNPPLNRKRPSPVENMLSSLPSTITWGNTTVLGSVKEQSTAEKPEYSDKEDSQEDGKPTLCVGISVTMYNQNAFDDDGCMSTPLLDQAHSALYIGYRRAYAELLYCWGHPLARLEILKFNGLRDSVTNPDISQSKAFVASVRSSDTHTSLHEPPPPSPIILGKKDSLHAAIRLQNQALDVTGYCLRHESRLEPLNLGNAGGAVGRCERCKTVQRQLRCTICQEAITGLFTPCLSCGCATHQHCLQKYQSFGNTNCPGGCDCDCGVKASAGIVESWEVMMNALERMRLADKNAAAKDRDKENRSEWDVSEKSDWENVNLPSGGLGRGYSTLSRRLGQVRTGEWGIRPAVRKKAGSLRKEPI